MVTYENLRRRLTDWSDVPLRIALGATFILHGLDKFENGLGGFATMLGQVGVPAPNLFAWIVAIAELAGGALVLIGLLTRLSALALLTDMAVAIAMVHYKQGFMLHSGPGPFPQGFEWQFALAMMALAMVVRGAGPLSIDYPVKSYLAAQKRREREQRLGEQRGPLTELKGRETASAGRATATTQPIEPIEEPLPQPRREPRPEERPPTL